MAQKTLAENVAKVKADFKAIKNMAKNVIKTDLSNIPTSKYAVELENGIYMYADGYYSRGIEEGSKQGYEFGLRDGKKQGRQEVIANCKYIEKSASGKVIRLYDVSEVAHKVVVKADEPTEVKVYSGNLIDYTKAETRDSKSDVVINADGSITYTGDYYFRIPIDTLERNTNYTLSYKGGADTAMWALAYAETGNNTSSVVAMGKALTTRDDTDVQYIFVYPYKANSDVTTTTISDIQLSFGVVVKPYEPYNKQIITATTSGAEISSLCPNMTFFADNDITVDYYGSYGMQAQYYAFWGEYLKDGDLYGAFSGHGWSDKNFEPPYDIVAKNSSSMFSYSYIEDVRGCLAKHNVKLVFDETGNQHYNVFQNSRVKYVPYLKLPTTATCYGWFTYCTKLIEVDGYECTEKHRFFAQNYHTFNGCTNLEHIIFNGTIGQDINLQWSKKLDLESALSLLWCLKDFNGTDDMFTKTITLSAEVWELLQTEEAMAELGGHTGNSFVEDKGWNAA